MSARMKAGICPFVRNFGPQTFACGPIFSRKGIFMSQIDVRHLTFSYDGALTPVFSDVSFRLDTDWRLGFVGRNGRGKTTFLKLLTGELPAGNAIQSSVPFARFPIDVPDSSCSVSELYTLVPGAEMWELERELRLLGLTEDALERPYASLSGGERTKVQVALLFLHEGSFCLLDEPTNHLDRAAREKLGAYLRSKKGFILVSHDRALLDRCTDHTLAINKTGIEVQKGSFSVWFAQKEQRDRREAAENEKLTQEITRLNDAARRAAGWSAQVEKSKKGTRNSGVRPDRGYIGHKSAKMMQRAKSIESRKSAAAQEKAALLHDVETAEALRLHVLPFPKTRLAEFDRVAVQFGERPVCAPVRFSVMRGDKIDLEGGNGAGKSSLLKLLLGENIPHTGNVFVPEGLQIAYLPQESEGLSGTLSDYIAGIGADETLCKTILRKLDFSREQFSVRLENASAGQKKKVQLAACLSLSAHLFILDEPLNYIDIWSRMQLETLFRESEATVLFVEHDAAFCSAVATETIRLTPPAKT